MTRSPTGVVHPKLKERKADYYGFTYTLTMHVATTLSPHNPDMVFCYISGSGTSVDSRLNWVQVKAKTENDLMQLPFADHYVVRPGSLSRSRE